MTDHDFEIVRRYTQGQSTSQIARELGLRLVDVIGRIRALELRPPGMGQRPTPAGEGVVLEAVACPAPEPQPVRRPVERRRKKPDAAVRGMPARVDGLDGLDFDDAEDEPFKRPGCPDGWLIPEDRYAAMFHPSRGRFEDAPIRPKPPKPAMHPIGSLTGQEAARRAARSWPMAAE